MKQFTLSFPSLQDFPRPAHPAYWRLEAVAHGMGCRLASLEEPAEGWIHLEKPVRSATEGEASLLAEGYELAPKGERQWTLRATKGAALGLYEIALQLLARNPNSNSLPFQPVSAFPWVPLRAVRYPAHRWREGCLETSLEALAMLGLNGLALDAFKMPEEERSVADEAEHSEWEVPFHRLLERCGREGWWRMAVLPIELDLGLETVPGIAPANTPLCRQIPANRRRLLHRLESILRRLPQVEAIGFSVTDWGRCRCEVCAKTSFIEEVAYYLRGYSAVLRRYSPATEIWVLPDELHWRGLQEVASQIPDHVRTLAPSRPNTDSRVDAGWEAGGGLSEGERIDLTAPFSGNLIDFDWIARTRETWRERGTPRLAVAEIDSDLPASLAGFQTLTWQTQSPSFTSREWALRRCLPPEEWENLRAWESRNRYLLRGFQPPLVPAPAMPGGTRRAAKDKGSEERKLSLDHLAEELSRKETRRHRLMPLDQPDLMEAARDACLRWQGEEALRRAMDWLDHFPEEGPLTPGILGRLFELQERLEAWGEGQWQVSFSDAERRCVETLKLHLGVLMGSSRTRRWNPLELPDLWIRSQLVSRRLEEEQLVG
jgi:hypothetical protein